MKWSRSSLSASVLVWLLLLLSFASAYAQEAPRDLNPRLVLSPQTPLDSALWRETTHTINRMALVVSNRGTLGKHSLDSDTERDYFSGEAILKGNIFPRGSGRNYLLNADLRVGHPARLHPALSAGYHFWWNVTSGEFLPDDPPGTMSRRSITDRFGAPDPNAISEEDILCHYTDSMVLLNYGLGRFATRKNMRSIGLAVDQQSYGWSMEYAEDIIFVSYDIRNYSDTVHHDVYVGLNMSPSPSVFLDCGGDGNMCGLRRRAPSTYGCGFVDTMDVVWNASVSGNPVEGFWVDKPRWDPDAMCYLASVRGIMGIMPLQTPASRGPYFNWWTDVYNSEYVDYFYYEPSKSGAPTFIETYYYPESVEEQYRLLSTHEIDPPTYLIHDVYANPSSEEWLPLPIIPANEVTLAGAWEDCLSWGPLTLGPGSSIRLTVAVVGGENLHHFTNNKFNLPFRASQFYDSLDFSDFNRNLTMAQWIYDNPGVDTDGDGYFGEYRVCVHDSTLIDGNWVATRADTQWYKGDGIPDYSGALPPPSPDVWVSQIHNGLHVRFNGQYSETEKDIFMQVPDWEGYRIYLGRDERETSLSLIGSYDKLDYDKLYYNQTLFDGPAWQMTDRPFSVEQLRCLYGSGPDPCADTAFDPLLYTQIRPYQKPGFPDSIFAFVPHDYNTSDLGMNTPVTKTYPNMPDPRLLPADSITADMYTEDGYLKFYEYQFDIENLLPTVSYYVSITSFDFGSPAQGLNPLESSKYDNVTEAFPMHDLDKPLSGSDKVYVYPNPYRIDADYRDLGYEGRAQDDRWDERVRSIWFGNLPPKCTINIFTLDGDRVRTIEHDIPITDPTYSKERWDLINRNFQIIVSGLYYWTVEAPDRDMQIGKLVILR